MFFLLEQTFQIHNWFRLGSLEPLKLYGYLSASFKQNGTINSIWITIIGYNVCCSIQSILICRNWCKWKKRNQHGDQKHQKLARKHPDFSTPMNRVNKNLCSASCALIEEQLHKRRRIFLQSTDFTLIDSNRCALHTFIKSSAHNCGHVKIIKNVTRWKLSIGNGI